MKIRHHKKPAGAFTLLEIMVALALLGVLISAVYSCWFSIIKGSAVAARAADTGQRSRIAMSTVRDALLCSVMYAQNVRYYAFDVSAEGDYSDISFTAHLPRSFLRSRKFDGADVRRVNFTIEDGQDGKKQLVLRQNVLLMDPDKDEMDNPVILAHDVQQFIVEFIDPKTGDWTGDWVYTNQLPPKIRVTLTIGDKNSGAAEESMVSTVALPAQTVRAEWQAPIGALIPGGVGPPPVQNNPQQQPNQNVPQNGQLNGNNNFSAPPITQGFGPH
jgi:general secretion pathway protein J